MAYSWYVLRSLLDLQGIQLAWNVSYYIICYSWPICVDDCEEFHITYIEYANLTHLYFVAQTWISATPFCDRMYLGIFYSFIFDCQFCQILSYKFLFFSCCCSWLFLPSLFVQFWLVQSPIGQLVFSSVSVLSKQFCPMLEWTGQNWTKRDIKLWNHQQK